MKEEFIPDCTQMEGQGVPPTEHPGLKVGPPQEEPFQPLSPQPLPEPPHRSISLYPALPLSSPGEEGEEGEVHPGEGYTNRPPHH